MKRIVMACTLLALFVLYAEPGITLAQEQQKQVISITDIEKLIDQKMSVEKPLTQEELTETLLTMKDDKIADLEGNISKTIDLFALFVGITAFILAAVTGLIGWIIKKNIDEKLTKIEEKEGNINQKYNDIQVRTETIEEYYKDLKGFKDDLETLDNRLDSITESIIMSKTEFQKLTDYVKIIEDINNSTILMLRFFNQKNSAVHLINKTKEMIQRPLNNPNGTYKKLEEKLIMPGQFSTPADIEKHLDYLVSEMFKEERTLWEMLELFSDVDKAHEIQDEDTMTFYEELETKFSDWESILDYIKDMKEIWGSDI